MSKKEYTCCDGGKTCNKCTPYSCEFDGKCENRSLVWSIKNPQP